MVNPAIGFAVLIAAGIYLEKLDWQEAGIWAIVAAFLGYLAFRTQGPLGLTVVWFFVDAVLALRIFPNGGKLGGTNLR
ncbi:MAG: hypothetical protein ACO1SV_21235 [Fimbriimonas sp.]